ncbi:hypothetical protein JOH51_006118 [Rhizobium leguminosarum]|nr:hypothetical protein [Rhizobium leguminosarum]
MANATHGEPVAWKLARPVRREGRRNHLPKGRQALCSYSTFSVVRDAPIAASMAVDETGNDRTAPIGPQRSEGRLWAEAFLFREEWPQIRSPHTTRHVGWSRPGEEKTSRPLREDDRAERARRFPVRYAPSRTAGASHCKGKARHWHVQVGLRVVGRNRTSPTHRVGSEFRPSSYGQRCCQFSRGSGPRGPAD